MPILRLLSKYPCWPRVLLPGWPSARVGEPRRHGGQPDSHSERRGPVRLLPERRVGHHQRHGQAQGEVLPLLPRALPGHHIQHHNPPPYSVLHDQPYHAMRRNFMHDCTRVLSAQWFGGENYAINFHSAGTDCVFPAFVWHQSPDIYRDSVNREVFDVHNDSSDYVHIPDSLHT